MKNEVLSEKGFYMVIDRSTVFLVLKLTLFIFFQNFFAKKNSVNIAFYWASFHYRHSDVKMLQKKYKK